MEIAYKVKQNSEYYKHAIDSFTFAEQEYKFVRDFIESHQGIECDFYVVRVMGALNTLITKENVDELEFGIEVDEEKLEEDILIQLKKANKNNVRFLKKNSKLMKEFRNLALERGLVTNVRTLTPIDFYDMRYIGRYSWNRLITSDGELYVKLNINTKQYNFIHDDFESIELIEYYRKVREFLKEKNSK